MDSKIYVFQFLLLLQKMISKIFHFFFGTIYGYILIAFISWEQLKDKLDNTFVN